MENKRYDEKLMIGLHALLILHVTQNTNIGKKRKVIACRRCIRAKEPRRIIIIKLY